MKHPVVRMMTDCAVLAVLSMVVVLFGLSTGIFVVDSIDSYMIGAGIGIGGALWATVSIAVLKAGWMPRNKATQESVQ